MNAPIQTQKISWPSLKWIVLDERGEPLARARTGAPFEARGLAKRIFPGQKLQIVAPTRLSKEKRIRAKRLTLLTIKRCAEAGIVLPPTYDAIREKIKARWLRAVGGAA